MVSHLSLKKTTFTNTKNTKSWNCQLCFWLSNKINFDELSHPNTLPSFYFQETFFHIFVDIFDKKQDQNFMIKIDQMRYPIGSNLWQNFQLSEDSLQPVCDKVLKVLYLDGYYPSVENSIWRVWILFWPLNNYHPDRPVKTRVCRWEGRLVPEM